MPAIIHRLVLKNGTEYVAREPWPGTPAVDPEDKAASYHQLKVGLISFLPAEEEAITDDEDEVIGTQSQEARYELWGLTDRIFANLTKLMQRETPSDEEVKYLEQVGALTRRVIMATEVATVDEQWPVGEGLNELAQRFIDMWGKSEDGEEKTSSSNGQAAGVAASQ